MRYIKETFLGSFNLQSNTTFCNQTLRYNAYAIARLLSFDVKSSNKFFSNKIAWLCSIITYTRILMERIPVECRHASGARARARDIDFIRIGERTLASLLKSHISYLRTRII